jgi:ribosomal protein S18 acetylase RimI-like enzyme
MKAQIILMHSVSVRIATASDLDKLAEMRLLLQQHSEKSNLRIWRITEEGKALLKQDMEKALLEGNTRIVVTTVNEEIVGYALGSVSHRTDYLPKTVGTIATIYVDEKHRRQGAGRHMVEELYKFFKAEKVEQVTLRYIVGNREAEAFWNKLEFTPIIKTASKNLKKQT